jgi:hypothetical protein
MRTFARAIVRIANLGGATADHRLSNRMGSRLRPNLHLKG